MATLDPGKVYTLRITISRVVRAGISTALRVTDGIDEETVRFGVDVDSNDRDLQQAEQSVVVGSHDGEVTVDFPMIVADSPHARWVWVRVSQAKHVVLQLELEIRTTRPDT